MVDKIKFFEKRIKVLEERKDRRQKKIDSMMGTTNRQGKKKQKHVLPITKMERIADLERTININKLMLGYELINTFNNKDSEDYE